MNLLDIAPLLSTILGLLLCVFIMFRKSGLGKNKKMRFVLSALVFLYTFIAFDYYLVLINHGNTDSFGMSDLFFHLTGFLFYYFISLFTKNKINLKKWGWVILGYTLARWSTFLPVLQYSSIESYIKYLESSNYGLVLYGEFIITSIINIILAILAFFKLKQTPTVIKFDEKQLLQYKWIHLVLVGFIVLQLAIFINNIIGLMGAFTWNAYEVNLKTDTLLIVIFFFVMAYSIMQFPVFAFSGDFEDLPETVKKKYAKSSLTDSSTLFSQIETLVREEKIYLEFDVKLNTLAERLDKSVHHISQAINQNADMSFPDYINSFRIEEAKKKLLEPKPDTILAISLDVGFNSKAAFYTAFKKATSQTPTAFKKAHKEENK